MKLYGVIPAVVCLVIGIHQVANAQALNATAIVNVSSQNVWDYTLTNSEPAISDNWLTDFFLPINAPVTNVTSANGWYVSTDSVSYIEWSNVENYPYPDDIAPGSSVSGFGFTSAAPGSQVQYNLATWNHSQDGAGPETTGNILAPSAPVPEASTFVSFGALLFFGGLGLVARKRAKHTT